MTAVEAIWPARATGSRGADLDAAARETLRTHYLTLANQQYRVRGARHIIDVSAANVLRIDRILALYPTARIVLVVRHPADQIRNQLHRHLVGYAEHHEIEPVDRRRIELCVPELAVGALERGIDVGDASPRHRVAGGEANVEVGVPRDQTE